jgi:hypothetical protein
VAYFAEIDSNNIVVRVLVVDNSQEYRGEEFLSQELNLGGKWVQTSYNAANNGFRKNYAGIGYSYNEDIDAFVPPKCHEEATLNNNTGLWNCANSYHFLDDTL